jgi:hypothetical protein
MYIQYYLNHVLGAHGETQTEASFLVEIEAPIH